MLLQSSRQRLWIFSKRWWFSFQTFPPKPISSTHNNSHHQSNQTILQIRFSYHYQNFINLLQIVISKIVVRTSTTISQWVEKSERISMKSITIQIIDFSLLQQHNYKLHNGKNHNKFQQLSRQPSSYQFLSHIGWEISRELSGRATSWAYTTSIQCRVALSLSRFPHSPLALSLSTQTSS